MTKLIQNELLEEVAVGMSREGEVIFSDKAINIQLNFLHDVHCLNRCHNVTNYVLHDGGVCR